MVVGAFQRTAAISLVADLTGNVAITTRDVVELGKLAMTHFDGLIAIVDDQNARHR
jgi:hypothetical protein